MRDRDRGLGQEWETGTGAGGLGQRGWDGSRDGAGPPQLLDQVFAFLDDVHGHLQGGLLLLAEALAEVLHGLHGLGVHVVQQFLLQLLQPCPQLWGQRREGPALWPGEGTRGSCSQRARREAGGGRGTPHGQPASGTQSRT